MTFVRALPIAAGLLGSTALYYGLRAAGVSVRSALIVNAVVAAAPTLLSLLRGRRPQGLAVLFTVLVLGGRAVVLLPGYFRCGVFDRSGEFHQSRALP